MHTNQIQILLKSANAYVTIAQSLRSCGISSWQHYATQAKSCLAKARILADNDKTITLAIKLVS